MKRGMSGIDTLIMFIAMVLVAAVAASVILSTSMSLQNKALDVGRQTKSRVSNAYEIVRVQGTANTSIHKITDLEVMVRLIAGSDAQDLRDMVMFVHTSGAFFEATLESTLHKNYWSADISDVIIASDPLSTDLGYDIDQIPDGLTDSIAVVQNCTGINECFKFYVGDEIFSFDTGVDFEGDDMLSLIDYPLYEDGDHSLLHGYFTFIANFSLISAGDGVTMSTVGFACEDYSAITNCSIRTEIDNNSFSTLKPLHRFAYNVKQGDSDLQLENSEIMAFRYKLTKSQFIPEEETFDVTIMGSSTMRKYVQCIVPYTLFESNLQLWP
jgi:flagellin-like protein